MKDFFTENGSCKNRRFFSRWSRVLLLMLICVTFSTTGASAANMISAAQKAELPEGKLVYRAKGTRYKLAANGNAVRKKWLYVDGNVYYFNEEGFAETGFFKYANKRYYANSRGIVQYGKWVNVNGKLYYMKKNGVLNSDAKKQVKGKKYKFDETGVLLSARPAVYPGSHYLFVGDSRTVGMHISVSAASNVSFLGEIGKGYNYLRSSCDGVIRSRLKSNPYLTVIFAFGVNDIGNIGSYINYYKRLINSYPDARFFFMAVNPVSYSQNVNNSMITSFNAQLRSAVGKSRYIDTYNYLSGTGYSTFDGIHYTVNTYQKLYTFVMDKVMP